MSFDLRSARMDRGLTQAELAHLLDVGRSTVIRLEQGARPQARTALKIAQWLGTRPSLLWPVEPLDKAAA